MTDDATAVPGSPRWWERREADSRRRGRRRGRPSRSLEQILETAVTLLDEGGADALSMRSLAAALDSSTATLYRQLPGGKEELEALIVDRLMGETMTELAQELQGSSSRPGVEHLAERIRIGAGTSFRVLRRHPAAARLFLLQRPVGPVALFRQEAGIQQMIRDGLAPADAADTYAALGRLVVGSAVQGADDEVAIVEEVREYYASLDPERFPALSGVTEYPRSLDAEFAYALELFIDGVVARVGNGDPRA
ncbi:MAG TPA: TetR/AcrR family transcriptional regulator [Gordonia sp. (in: high G+C Gram-positive bacteria)]|uniref:TetR/AcrR family transcriptional regulator n=1 Tax=unclassified Gordonia (in: high G+C Gram-positive bacteria) TaxID=2657482 RepID=UPI0025C4ED62|nr:MULTISPECIES: TetR/AcrR family transcriptional regulator [unclassified Gordonia (in: high G+C Gram-positive bacteria)]HNP57099.1 TetR/AcrR family transcriptional regulator [Gordonia sp. (in: high G+C Gram-positive bacteria)]HRC49364.1 TetR/AcrR family transcriptional regulator [Gordonia sp. (in: high G+C Gram-positive bacteria)]